MIYLVSVVRVPITRKINLEFIVVFVNNFGQLFQNISFLLCMSQTISTTGLGVRNVNLKTF